MHNNVRKKKNHVVLNLTSAKLCIVANITHNFNSFKTSLESKIVILKIDTVQFFLSNVRGKVTSYQYTCSKDSKFQEYPILCPR